MRKKRINAGNGENGIAHGLVVKAVCSDFMARIAAPMNTLRYFLRRVSDEIKGARDLMPREDVEHAGRSMAKALVKWRPRAHIGFHVETEKDFKAAHGNTGNLSGPGGKAHDGVVGQIWLANIHATNLRYDWDIAFDHECILSSRNLYRLDSDRFIGAVTNDAPARNFPQRNRPGILIVEVDVQDGMRSFPTRVENHQRLMAMRFPIFQCRIVGVVGGQIAIGKNPDLLPKNSVEGGRQRAQAETSTKEVNSGPSSSLPFAVIWHPFSHRRPKTRPFSFANSLPSGV